MTPMVDVAFLLLTFFMLTTVFSRPQAMEVNIPQSDAPIDVAQSNLLTLRGADDGKIYWDIAGQAPQVIEYSELNDLLTRQARANPELVTLVKVSREGTYTNAVDILDELNVTNVTRFSIAPLTPEDSTLILQTRAGA